ncbi:uncharacterized protein LOC113370313 [Ctenocephalides felis]|uniref:uncharacterized protein LOC113370313 n=1 Tax=Ctenocephalides felis TaxID=7515 RepID=UPI000E6E4AA9|nr:uncharacterized protein LOC113370313 [Ctenocephalides felis]
MRITREIAKELSAPHPSRMEFWQRHVKAAEARCQQDSKKKKCQAATTFSSPKAHPDPKDMTYVYCPCTNRSICENMAKKQSDLEHPTKSVNLPQQKTVDPQVKICPVHGRKMK